jgi:FKBP-type peptidyl-prolyl cis-trans isomerase (trigger factor)
MTEPKITAVVARSEDKTIQITFTIPAPLVQKAQDEVISDVTKDAEIPGFRKGKAPEEKVREKIPAGDLIEKSLAKILPQALAEAINTNKIRPAIYPKFELIKAEAGKDWEVRASTCELPEIILTDYKGAIKTGIIKVNDMKPEEKEQKVIKVLLDSQRIDIPQLLINEEVDARLAQLLERIEKLGLTLEGYLGSIGKTPQSLREEYSVQSKNTIILELLLNKIAEEQKIEISEQKIDEAIKAASADPKLAERLNTPEQRRLIKGVLGRRATLDYLISLV